MQKLLFVCTGNICRSPTAEAVARYIIEQHNYPMSVDSAGISDYHEGDGADQRSIQAAQSRGYDMTQLRARAVTKDDFFNNNSIIAMTQEHKKDLNRMAQECQASVPIELLMDYHPSARSNEVPDPYYGGKSGFEDVLTMIEIATDHLIHHLLKKRGVS